MMFYKSDSYFFNHLIINNYLYCVNSYKIYSISNNTNIVDVRMSITALLKAVGSTCEAAVKGTSRLFADLSTTRSTSGDHKAQLKWSS